MKPAYLFSGSDSDKIRETRARLRGRAEADSGVAGLEVFEPIESKGSPDIDAVCASIPAMSLTAGRRYILVDGVEKWRAKQVEKLGNAAGDALPDETTLVLIAHGKAPQGLTEIVKRVGGETKNFAAPKPAELPRYLMREARERGFNLDEGGARELVQRIGQNQLRLGNELDRLAVWAEGGEVTEQDLRVMIADSSQAVVWSLADAVIDRDCAYAVSLAEELLEQGDSVAGLVSAVAGRLRKAHLAAEMLAGGQSSRQVQDGLDMHPYGAKLLLQRVEGTSPDLLARAKIAVADLEAWTRGETEYGDRLAVTLAIRRACGGPTSTAAEQAELRPEVTG